MAAREQLATKSSADETRRTGDENAHVEPQGKAGFPLQSENGILASHYLHGAGATTIRALSESKAARVTISFYPVILSGGSGSRLWPMSRRLLPKQFLPLVSQRTMLQDTVLRLQGFGGALAPIVVSN